MRLVLAGVREERLSSTDRKGGGLKVAEESVMGKVIMYPQIEGGKNWFQNGESRLFLDKKLRLEKKNRDGGSAQNIRVNVGKGK